MHKLFNQRLFLLFTILNLFLSSLAAQEDTIAMRDTFAHDTMQPTEIHTIYIGKDSLQILVYRISDNGLTFFNMHDDENICVAEGLKTVKETGGKLIELRHFGDLADRGRYFSFSHENKVFTFDPNRIFSDSDSIRARTLINKRGYYQGLDVVKRLKSTTVPSIDQCKAVAISHLKPLADTILAIIDTSKTKLIVALHNNHGFEARCEANKVRPASYNLATYMRKGTLENSSCSDIYVNPRHELTGFFIVLDYADFLHCVEHRCNAVLQSSNPPDDASFSVFAAANNLKYINIEAKFDRRAEQAQLLQKLQEYWTKKGNTKEEEK